MRTVTQKLALAASMATLLLVLSPAFSNAAKQLFAFHMAQHLLLIAAVAPLLIYSRIFERLQNQLVIRKLASPVTAWLSFVGVFLFWHWPAAFQWAARNEVSRLLEHISILCGALLFWSVALSLKDQEWLSYGARALFIMMAAVATDLPGVIMIFAPHAFCAMPEENAARWGLSTIEDQQIAGMLMWVPTNLVFFGIATWLFLRWISDTSARLSTSSTHYVEVP